MTKLKNAVVARIVFVFLALVTGARLLTGRLFLWAQSPLQPSTQFSVPGVRILSAATPSTAQKVPVVSGNSVSNDSGASRGAQTAGGDYLMAPRALFTNYKCCGEDLPRAQTAPSGLLRQ